MLGQLMKMPPELPAFLQAPPPREVRFDEPLIARATRRYWLQPKLGAGAGVATCLGIPLMDIIRGHAAPSQALADVPLFVGVTLVMIVIPLWFYARSNARAVVDLVRLGELAESTVARAVVVNAMPFITVAFTTRDGTSWGAKFPVPTGAGTKIHAGDHLHVLLGADGMAGIVTTEGVFVDRATRSTP
jgi:hypothetical protein